MFIIFTQLADWLTYSVMGLSPDSKLADAVHFFIEDVTKIYALLMIMIYFIALLRASLNVERVRDYLAGKNRGIGYLLGSSFGAITPFCSCSSISRVYLCGHSRRHNHVFSSYLAANK